jgi:hypothetical protein
MAVQRARRHGAARRVARAAGAAPQHTPDALIAGSCSAGAGCAQRSDEGGAWGMDMSWRELPLRARAQHARRRATTHTPHSARNY